MEDSCMIYVLGVRTGTFLPPRGLPSGESAAQDKARRLEGGYLHCIEQNRNCSIGTCMQMTSSLHSEMEWIWEMGKSISLSWNK